MRLIGNEMAVILGAELLVSVLTGTPAEVVYEKTVGVADMQYDHPKTRPKEWIIEKMEECSRLADTVSDEDIPAFFRTLLTLWTIAYKDKLLSRPLSSFDRTEVGKRRLMAVMMVTAPEVMLTSDPLKSVMLIEQILGAYGKLQEIMADNLADSDLFYDKRLVDSHV